MRGCRFSKIDTYGCGLQPHLMCQFSVRPRRLGRAVLRKVIAITQNISRVDTLISQQKHSETQRGMPIFSAAVNGGWLGFAMAQIAEGGATLERSLGCGYCLSRYRSTQPTRLYHVKFEEASQFSQNGIPKKLIFDTIDGTLFILRILNKSVSNCSGLWTYL